MNGFNHFRKMKMMKGYASSKGVPMAGLAIAITGLMILLGGLGILLGTYIQLSVLLLAIFLIFVTFKMHNFWAITEPNMKMMEMVNFYKNLALLGAVLMILFIPSPWVYSI
jgi:putative oxidoreductase